MNFLTCQSINIVLLNHIHSFNRKSDFWRLENLNKTIIKGEKLNDVDFSLLSEFWINNYTYEILIVETDRLSVDVKYLLVDHDLMIYHPSRSDNLSVHVRIDIISYKRLLYKSSEEDNKIKHAVIFDMKFDKKTEEVITDSRERIADPVFIDLETISLIIEDSALIIIEDNFESMINYIQVIKESHLRIRSDLQNLRYCVCHLNHRIWSHLVVIDYFSKSYFRKYIISRSLYMDSVTTRGICRREDVEKVKTQKMQILWLLQLVMLMIRKMKLSRYSDKIISNWCIEIA